MDSDNKALKLLKQYLSEGSNYYDARQKLIKNGFSEVDIDSATNAHKSGKDTVIFNEALAEALVKTESVKEQDRTRDNQNQSRNLYAPLSTSPVGWIRVFLPMRYRFAVGLVIIVGLLVVVFTRVIK